MIIYYTAKQKISRSVDITKLEIKLIDDMVEL